MICLTGYGSILLILILLFILARKRRMGISAYLYEAGRKKGMFGSEGIREKLRVLQPDSCGKTGKEEEYLQKFYTAKIKLLLQMLLAGSIFAMCLLFSSRMEGVLEDGRYVRRNTYGLGSVETKLQAEIVEQDGTSGYQDFTFMAEERRYEDAWVKKLAGELAEKLPDMILGNNSSLEEVREDLDLIRQAEGYPFRITWESDDYSCIYSDGKLVNEALGENGTVVCLTAALTYEDYREEHIFPVHIFPPAYSEEESLAKKLSELLEVQEKQSRYEELVELPQNVEGKQVFWSEEREDRSGMMFCLVCIGAAAVYFLRDKDLQDKVEKRNKQMLMDYPQLVSRMTLYMGAGMTVRNVFRKIAFDYQKEKQEGGEMHYVYEEMLITCYELESGVSETAAYERFGKRCRMIQYMKFTNLLVQNLKKGSNSILDALRQEAKNAFEDRRNMARKLGEEAGTKLLLPMMLMLGIVMVLIIIPAYFSFSL